jgi:transposase
MDIQQLHKQGFSVCKIARKLGISRTTVYKYMKKTPEEMCVWIASSKSRKKKLDSYHDLILGWLRDHPDLSAAQINDWLLERFKDFNVAESTVRSYVRELREKYHIPKTEVKRMYQAIARPADGTTSTSRFWTNHSKDKPRKINEIVFYQFCSLPFSL